MSPPDSSAEADGNDVPRGLFARRLYDFAAFHHKRHGLKPRDVRQRIAGNSDQVAKPPNRDGAYIAGAAERLGGVGSCRLNGLHWRHSPFDHGDELARVIAVGIYA